MSKLRCPHCGKTGISVLRKWCLGPAIPATCTLCGKKIGVPYSYVLIEMIPFFIAAALSQYAESFELIAAIWIIAFIVLSVIHVFFVPLESR